ncbi:MAG: hypothetical protein K2I28_07590 [Muribaculaceae bacterium]|nr:hypothetical protein [Muribaculaceae bacterium]
MALRPKLEFIRFTLNPKDNGYRTFRDFAVDELYQRRPSSDAQIMHKLFDYFMNSMATDMAIDRSVKKQIKLITTKANKYIDHRPVVEPNDYLIHGVINGGRFGRNGMMGDSSAASDDAAAFGPDKTILRYYYFLLYLPLDHNEGCLIVHSNSREETVTDVFKSFLTRVFVGGMYSKPKLYLFAPRSFVEEYVNESVVKSLEFKETYLNGVFTEEGIGESVKHFDVKIEIIPKDGFLKLDALKKLEPFLKKLGFSRSDQSESLAEFKSKRVKLRSPFDSSDRTFELDREGMDIVPVVYLDRRITKFNDDDTPDFDELDVLARNVFYDEVLPELRPDLA